MTLRNTGRTPLTEHGAGLLDARDPLDNERVKKGVMRARGWLSAGANRDPKLATVEMIDAFAHDVIEFAGEIVRLRPKLEAEQFADSVLRMVEGECPSYVRVSGATTYCSEALDHDGAHRARLGGVDHTWQTEAESGR